MLNGVPAAQLAAERSKYIDEQFPEGESYRDVVERVQDFLNDLSRDWDGKRVVIIGHSATRHALDVMLDGKELSDVVNTSFVWQDEWRYILA